MGPSYPLLEGTTEEVVFNMVNAILLRVHQSGHLAQISPEREPGQRKAWMTQQTICAYLREALPCFLPIGLSHFGDEWSCLGLRRGNK